MDARHLHLETSLSLPSVGRRGFLFRCEGGFSLVELIVVMGIMLVIVGLATPAIMGVKRGMDLRTGATQLLDQLTIARQTACTRNLPVEVRLYCIDTVNPSTPDSVALYTILADGSARAIQKRFILPDTVKISRNSKFSSLLQPLFSGAAIVKPGDTAESHSFRFNPNGTINLTAQDSPTLTLMLRTDDKGDILPANFVTIRLDLQTGRVQTFRP